MTNSIPFKTSLTLLSFFLLENQTFDAGVKAVGGTIDQKLKDANAFADASRDDLEKVFIKNTLKLS